MHRQNWDDLRFVLAVAETGSVSEAARQLNVTHATVLRRVAAFEERQSEPIFLRGPKGYSVLPDKQAVLDAAHDVENAVLTVERLLKGTAATLKGPVRITSTDSLCQTVLPGIVAEIGERFPDLRLSLLSGNRRLDLNRLAADITVRPGAQLDDRTVGVQAGVLGFGVYRQKSSKGPQKWLSLEGPLARSKPAVWMAETLRRAEICAGSDSFLVLREMVAGGMGQCFLPSILGEGDQRLVRADVNAPKISVPLWVGSPADMAHTPKLKAVTGMLVEGLKRAEAVLAA